VAVVEKYQGDQFSGEDGVGYNLFLCYVFSVAALEELFKVTHLQVRIFNLFADFRCMLYSKRDKRNYHPKHLGL
jgi:hypothetical protein